MGISQAGNSTVSVETTRIIVNLPPLREPD